MPTMNTSYYRITSWSPDSTGFPSTGAQCPLLVYMQNPEKQLSINEFSEAQLRLKSFKFFIKKILHSTSIKHAN